MLHVNMLHVTWVFFTPPCDIGAMIVSHVDRQERRGVPSSNQIGGTAFGV